MMPNATNLWITVAVIVGQGALVGAVIHLARSFGAYTNVVLQTHQQNMLIQQANFDMSDDLAHLRAQLLIERRAQRPHQPPQSEECIA